MSEYIFALDIGTRSVTGLLLNKQGDSYSVIDYEMIEHKERSMRDGQIHNVVAVAEVINSVKEKLENNSNITLTKVCVAAAGRALKTMEATTSIALHQQPITTDETIKHLELSAVQTAQHKLAEQGGNTDYSNYYCVGYSVLHYKLDDELIGSLIDQSGEKASVDIIATFLPKVVVESLLAALARANLEMEALTLEPIAAIQVLIPESMRRLNVALVDIGAGTSDIAITDKGTVSAYGMVPVAGDEITEAISDYYLLDFSKAEEVKRTIVNNGEATVSDILGFESNITYKMLIHDIQASVDKLADTIANEILQLNAVPPRAVMLVGGGSLTPELTNLLADKLDLPHNRVAVRGIDAIQNLIQKENVPKGPVFVTPIGIAIAAKQNPVHYVSVQVNKRLIRLFEMKKLTVGDCLIQAGFDLNKLYGRPGMASIVQVNGKEITIPGNLGEPPLIKLNKENCGVDDLIKDGDEIEIIPGTDGTVAAITLEELVGQAPTSTVFYNGKPYSLPFKLYVNGMVQSGTYIVKNRDRIEWKQKQTIQDFLYTNSTENLSTTKPFTITLNNRYLELEKGQLQLFVNGEKASSDRLLNHNDKLEVISAESPVVADLLNQLHKHPIHSINVTFNGEPIHITKKLLTIKRGQEELKNESQLLAGDELELEEFLPSPFIFQDIFRYVQLDLKNAHGNFKLYKNDNPTSFDEEITSGDRLELSWE